MVLREIEDGARTARVTYYRTGIRLAQGNVPVDRIAAARILHVGTGSPPR